MKYPLTAGDRAGRMISPGPFLVRLPSGYQAAEARSRHRPGQFLRQFAFLDPEHSRSGKPHLPAGRRRKGADEKVAKGGSGVRAATLPTTNHIVAFGDEVGSTPEVEVGKRLAEPHDEVPYVLASATRRIQGILKKHVLCSEFVDDLGVPRIAPEPLEPAAYNGFVIGFARHVFDPLKAVNACRRAHHYLGVAAAYIRILR